MPTNPDSIVAAISDAIATGFRSRLIAQGQARAIIWREGVLPPGAPAFAPHLSFDLHGYAYGLLGLGLRFEGVVIGGSALGLMGIIQRPTRDFDILVPELPPAIASAARDFAKAQRNAGVDLLDDWLNNGPMQLGEVLPVGWRQRVQRIFEGQVLVLSTLGRPDLLKSKLFALCDRGTDLPDSIALAPTAEELAECVPWLEVQDGNELWPAHVRATVADLARRLGHGV